MKCDLMKNGKCSCATKCAKLIWYEQGRADAVEKMMKCKFVFHGMDLSDEVRYLLSEWFKKEQKND